MNRVVRLALPALALVLGTACVEMEMNTLIKKNGSGKMETLVAFTPKFVEILHKMEGLDPSGGGIGDVTKSLPQPPDADTKKRLRQAGLKVLDVQSIASDTEISSYMAVKFDHLSALEHLRELRPSEGGSSDDAWHLVSEPDGSYTLSMGRGAGSLGEGAFGGLGSQDETTDDGETPADPGASFEQVMGMLGELMTEAAKFKIEMSVTVPGDVIAAKPSDGATVDGHTARWYYDWSSMMGMSMQGDIDPDAFGTFSVKFRPNKPLPESALLP